VRPCRALKKLHNEGREGGAYYFRLLYRLFRRGVSPFVLQTSGIHESVQRPQDHVASTGQWEEGKGYPGQSVYSNRIILHVPPKIFPSSLSLPYVLPPLPLFSPTGIT
jgi:hypothetical protein